MQRLTMTEYNLS